jgi:hypothetical protein
MDPSQLTAKQIREALVGIIYRFRGRLHRLEQDVLDEAARRVRRHEALVQDVLPNLPGRPPPRTRSGAANFSLSGIPGPWLALGRSSRL